MKYAVLSVLLLLFGFAATAQAAETCCPDAPCCEAVADCCD